LLLKLLKRLRHVSCFFQVRKGRLQIFYDKVRLVCGHGRDGLIQLRQLHAHLLRVFGERLQRLGDFLALGFVARGVFIAHSLGCFLEFFQIFLEFLQCVGIACRRAQLLLH